MVGRLAVWLFNWFPLSPLQVKLLAGDLRAAQILVEGRWETRAPDHQTTNWREADGQLFEHEGAFQDGSNPTLPTSMIGQMVSTYRHKMNTNVCKLHDKMRVHILLFCLGPYFFVWGRIP